MTVNDWVLARANGENSSNSANSEHAILHFCPCFWQRLPNAFPQIVQLAAIAAVTVVHFAPIQGKRCKDIRPGEGIVKLRNGIFDATVSIIDFRTKVHNCQDLANVTLKTCSIVTREKRLTAGRHTGRPLRKTLRA